MDHYQVLGVARGVTQAEIRQAYIARAREHHPDHHRAEGARAAAEAEDRMRRVNEAWDVLGDPLRRRSYDEHLLWQEELDRRQGTGASGSQITAPSATFVPHRPDTPEDPDEDDSWRFEPDEGDPATIPPRALLAAPPALFALGLGLLVLSLPTGIRWFAALGLILLLASALFFVGAPVIALFRSQVAEQRAHQRRRRR